MIPFAALLPAPPKSHRGETVSRHAEAFMPPPTYGMLPYPAHFGHRPGTFDGCYGRHCSGQHNFSREVQK